MENSSSSAATNHPCDIMSSGDDSQPSNGSSSVVDNTDDIDKEGCLLWAKLKGYSYWPGIVTVDPMDGLTVKLADTVASPNVKRGGSRRRAHIHFLGYDNMRAWVGETNLMSYKGKEAYEQVAAKCPAQKKKDFYPSKRYQKLFDKAIQVADDTLPMSLNERLKSLGLVYVLIDEEATEETDHVGEKPSLPQQPAKTPKSRKRKASAATTENNSSTTKTKSFKTDDAITNNGHRSDIKQAVSKSTKIDVYEFDDDEDNVPPLCVDISRPEKSFLKIAKPEAAEEATTPSNKNSKASKAKKKPAVQRPKTSAKKGQKSISKRCASSPAAVRVSSPQDDGVLMEDLTKANNVKDEFDSDRGQGSDDDTTKLGSLVWGQMSGFPYWPCFVTKSPDGDHKRSIGKRAEYHAQFFNWNDESGWITGSMPWCPINDYHTKAKIACPKGPSSPEGKGWYPPARLAAKWKGAVIEAQKTAKVSRRERHNSHVVFYQSDLLDSELMFVASADKDETIPSKAVITAAAKKQMPASSSNGQHRNTAGEKKQSSKSSSACPKSRKRRRKSFGHHDKPCPASRKKGLLVHGLPPAKIELPKGWTYDITDDKRIEYHSPEGIVYKGVEHAISHLFQQNCGPPRKRSYSTSSLRHIEPGSSSDRFGWFLESTDRMHFKTTTVPCILDQVGPLEGPVEYLKDTSLPPAWSIRRTKNRSSNQVEDVLYLSSLTSDSALRFTDKVSVARFLEGAGHPAVEIEELLHNFPGIARVAPKDTRNPAENGGNPGQAGPGKAVCSIVLTEWSVDDVGANPLLGKTVVPCYVDMVQLPDVFLRHPSVRVRESDNEMVIRDSITDEFIAKKIIYD
jgi:hypothetical protein